MKSVHFWIAETLTAQSAVIKYSRSKSPFRSPFRPPYPPRSPLPPSFPATRGGMTKDASLFVPWGKPEDASLLLHGDLGGSTMYRIAEQTAVI